MFEFPSLLWFLPLVGLPILIHLINVLRHQRVRWAAMEFLLQSQKRNRTWVMLKQLLLLLLRVIAVAAVVLMVAQPKARNSLGALFGESKTHHIVLLDDSYSMSDHWADTSAFAQATAAVDRLGKQLVRQGGQQEFTLLLFSQASRDGNGVKAALSREPITRDFEQTLSGKLASLHASELATGPAEGLAAIRQMVRESSDSSTMVYLVSDFRAKEWDNATDLRKALLELNSVGGQLQLVDCVDAARPNLVVSGLKPGLGIRAAGVPLKMEVSVTNYGPQAVHDVSVQLEEDGLARPAVTIASIPAGQTASADFEVRYQFPGQHSISAKLPADAVAADNARYTVLDFPDSVPVLVIDGDPQAAAHKGDAHFIALPFSSNNVTPTGIKPRIESPRFLREKPLDAFHVIYVLDVERLELPEREALENYAKAGGGVAFFVGDRTHADFINSQLYRDGKGIFPIPLVGPTELLVDRTETASDLTAEANHPVFSLFASQPNVDIDKVIVEKYFAADKHWTAAANSTARVVAHLRNGAPLVVEQQFGAGRVMAFLTTAAPTWNNLAKTPRHIGAMLQLAAYLSAARQTDPSRQVGTPLEIEFDRAKYQPQVRFVTPQAGSAGTFAMEAAPVTGADAAKHAASEAANASALMRAVLPGDAVLSGVYNVQLTAADNRPETRKFAYNVVPEEGNLKMIDGPELDSRLGGVKYRFHHADDAFVDTEDFDRSNLSRLVLYALVGLLVGEQLLAYSASYHPTAKEMAR